MARIRSVKPEIRRSLTVAEWPREVRLAWIYLWMYLDDEGRGLDDMRLLVAELFPLDRDVSEKKMDRWLELMATTKTTEDDVPPLCRYEVQGRRYLHATGWVHQKINRPQDSRLPQCPVHEGSRNGSVSSSLNDSLNGAVSDSLSDSPPSRAPADQGTRERGSRDQGNMIAPTNGATRRRDELFDALAEACSVDVPSLTKSGLGAFTGALKQLRDVEATPNQVKVRARRYRATFRSVSLTAPALAKHWASLAQPSGDTATHLEPWEQ